MEETRIASGHGIQGLLDQRNGRLVDALPQ